MLIEAGLITSQLDPMAALMWCTALYEQQHVPLLTSSVSMMVAAAQTTKTNVPSICIHATDHRVLTQHRCKLLVEPSSMYATWQCGCLGGNAHIFINIPQHTAGPCTINTVWVQFSPPCFTQKPHTPADSTGCKATSDVAASPVLQACCPTQHKACSSRQRYFSVLVQQLL